MNESTTDRPNLVFIMSDQHHAGVMGCADDPVAETPNLDRLAQDGVQFDNAYCTSPLCAPSRMSFLTGRHPHEIEVWTNEHVLGSDVPTIAHAMGREGYEPHLIGKLHAVGPDQLLGFADREVGDHGPNRIGGRRAPRGALGGGPGPWLSSIIESGPGRHAYQVKDEEVAATAVRYIDRVGSRLRGGVRLTPFSLSLGFMLPHQPYVARPDDFDRFDGRVDLPDTDVPFDEGLHPFDRWWREQAGIDAPVDREAVLRARAAYWAMVSTLDGLVGRVIDALERNDLLDDTLVVYTSDHGDQIGERGLWWKQTMYEGSIRVPLIMRWPSRLPRGMRSPHVVDLLDVNATILDALRCRPLPGAHGRSLLPLLSGTTTEWEDVTLAEYCIDEGYRQRMIRSGRWKLIYHDGLPDQLFDLADDPNELNDLAGDPAYQEVQARLTERVLQHWDPNWVTSRMAEKREQGDYLRAWTERTEPPDVHRWEMLAEMNTLGREDAAGVPGT